MTDPLETRLRSLAKDLPYPPTPRVAEKVMTRLRAPRPNAPRLAWGLALIVFLCAGLMTVAPVRAAVLEFIRVGVVRIFPVPVPTAEAPSTALPEPMGIVTATPALQATTLVPLLEQMSGETDLETARSQVGFPIPLPTYPSDLGPPDRVFVQDANGWMVILVWFEPERPAQVRMSLHLVEAGSWVIEKYQPASIQETSVHGLPAIWTEGPYPLLLRSRTIEWTRLVDGHVLIWVQDDLTYRLETNLSIEEAVRVAESLQGAGLSP